jgi:hypothetical protein
MKQNISVKWTKNELFVFRLFTVYFISHLIFFSQYFGGDLYQYSGKLLSNISVAFIHLLNHLFLHKKLSGDLDYTADTIWGYTMVLSFFLIAIIITLLWTIIDKRKYHPVLFIYLHAIARYYLAFALLAYGFSKLFGNQFFIPQWGLITTLSDLPPQHVLWSFMATSKSYQIFGGLMEIVPAILLLFRRTSTIGAMLAIIVVLNVLMLNIGYDVSLKLILLHLIGSAFFILAPDIKRLFHFFALKQNASLTIVSPVLFNHKHRWLHYVLKACLILFIVFGDIKHNIDRINEKVNFPQSSILGMHKIKDFYLNHETSSRVSCDPMCWKKIAIYPNSQILIQFMNDSIAWYPSKSDTTLESLELFSRDDSSFKCKLHYTKVKPNEWLFKGVLKNDSIRFNSTKIDLNNSTLLKDFGKTKWIYN